jgi:hypothetical protein
MPLLMTTIAGQCKFDRVVGDTSAAARMVHPFALPSISAECLHPSRSCVSEFAVPQSRRAQVLMPRERRASSIPSALAPKYTLFSAPPTWGVVSLLHGLGSDPHRCAERAIFPNAYLSTRAYAASWDSAAAISGRGTRKARPACSTTSRDLPVHIFTTHPCCCCYPCF